MKNTLIDGLRSWIWSCFAILILRRSRKLKYHCNADKILYKQHIITLPHHCNTYEQSILSIYTPTSNNKQQAQRQRPTSLRSEQKTNDKEQQNPGIQEQTKAKTDKSREFADWNKVKVYKIPYWTCYCVKWKRLWTYLDWEAWWAKKKKRKRVCNNENLLSFLNA